MTFDRCTDRNVDKDNFPAQLPFSNRQEKMQGKNIFPVLLISRYLGQNRPAHTTGMGVYICHLIELLIKFLLPQLSQHQTKKDKTRVNQDKKLPMLGSASARITAKRSCSPGCRYQDSWGLGP